MGEQSNKKGVIAEELFMKWHRQIVSYIGHQNSATVLKDVRENIAYTVPADIDFVITKQDSSKLVFHEVKYFGSALQTGNFYLEEVKETTKTDFQTVLNRENIKLWEKPKTGEELEYLPDQLKYVPGAGWIYKNTEFHADFYDFYMPAGQVKKYQATADELKQMQKQAKSGVKLITEVPTGLLISMSHNTATNLYRNAKADQEYANSLEKNNRHTGNFVGLNFSTALIMTAEKVQALIDIEWPLMGKLQMQVQNMPFTLQIRPVVKYVMPDAPSKKDTEIMETAVSTYCIPRRLMDICRQPDAYKLYTNTYPSKHDCAKLAQEMRAKIVEVLEEATVI